jgi:hypothetical protein
MSGISVRKYQPEDDTLWNDFVRRSKNGTFLFDRGFMDYHGSRFKDHSLMIYEDDALKSVMAANEDGDSVASHGGLSYGGFLLEWDSHLADGLKYFHYGLKYLHESGFRDLTYKCVPAYLAQLPSFEDEYALFLVNATLIRRDMSAVYSRSQPLPLRETRKHIVRKAMSRRLRVIRSDDPTLFWGILETNLLKHHGTKPVHTLEEITLIMRRFPKEIHCFEVHGSKEILGGAIIFETPTAVHSQYISATPDGKDTGALDLLFHMLMNDTFKANPYFSFGTSNEKEGRHLNVGLNSWKEGFGARNFPLDVYRVETANYPLLSSYA